MPRDFPQHASSSVARSHLYIPTVPTQTSPDKAIFNVDPTSSSPLSSRNDQPLSSKILAPSAIERCAPGTSMQLAACYFENTATGRRSGRSRQRYVSRGERAEYATDALDIEADRQVSVSLPCKLAVDLTKLRRVLMLRSSTAVVNRITF